MRAGWPSITPPAASACSSSQRCRESASDCWPCCASRIDRMNPPSHRFDLIAFDWDGTLFDSTALIVRCIQQACADLGVPVPSDEQAAFVIGLGLHDALAHAAPGLPPERYPELGARYRHHYFERQHELVLFDGALDLLHALKARNQRIAVATG